MLEKKKQLCYSCWCASYRANCFPIRYGILHFTNLVTKRFHFFYM